jgi:AraC-like DNA-binding protein
MNHGDISLGRPSGYYGRRVLPALTKRAVPGNQLRQMPTPTVLVTSTLAMVRAAEARGVDVREVLEGAGVPFERLQQPDGRIPVPVSLAIWDELRDRTQNATLQLVAPTGLPVGAYRVLDHLVGTSATVGEGVRRFARFFDLINPTVALAVQSGEREWSLVATLADGRAVPPVYLDYIFAALVGRVRAYFRPGLRVARLDLRRSAPADPSPYHEVFQAEVNFGAAGDRLCFSDEEWRAPLETHDQLLAQVLEAHARIRLGRATGETSPLRFELQRAILGALPDGALVPDVARALHMSARTLQRKLAEEGTTYREALDTVRRDLACRYLGDRTLSISEVAMLLGFSEKSSFHRAFERWTGESPGRWRSGHAVPEPGSHGG